jgi:hypothetical protein
LTKEICVIKEKQDRTVRRQDSEAEIISMSSRNSRDRGMMSMTQMLKNDA